MTEAEWLASEEPDKVIGKVRDQSARKERLFAVACCRCNGQLLSNGDHRRAVEVAERFADGLASEEELGAERARASALALELHGRTDSEPDIHRWAEAIAVAGATRADATAHDVLWGIRRATTEYEAISRRLAALVRDIFRNPYRPLESSPEWRYNHARSLQEIETLCASFGEVFSPRWRTDTVMSLARGMYESRDFSAMPILADALQDAGCGNDEILNHCRTPGEHVRGCWVTDLVLGKE